MSQISVIIPVYNAEKTLTRCLDSIMKQTFDDFEAILINDGSKDKSEEICSKYCEKDNRFRLISQENAGPSKARNRGIDEAVSKYLAFVDTDDYIEPDMLENLFNAAEESMAELTVCGYYNEKENGSKNIHSFKYAPGVYKGEELKKIVMEAIDMGVNGNIPPYSCIRFVKKECMENPRIRFNTDIYRSEDYLIWNILFSKISCLCLITDKPLYHYIENESSITHRYIKNYWDMSKIIYNELEKIYPSDKDVKEHLDIMLMRRACLSLSIACRSAERKIFYEDVKKVLSDKVLHGVIKAIPFKIGVKRERIRYILFKFRLYFIIWLIFGLRHAKMHK